MEETFPPWKTESSLRHPSQKSEWSPKIPHPVVTVREPQEVLHAHVDKRTD